ncbi:MAG: glutamate 5-kinase [Nitrospinae bacterium]|nr:glutamate 5-kinase [Nitrospinota bacterium]
MYRSDILKNIRRIVIKIGSAVLTSPLREGLDTSIIEEIVQQILDLKRSGLEIIIVSSGAIAAGVKVLKFKGIHRSIPQKQAIASVGQSHLIATYERYFGRKEQKVAQILLTHDDLTNRNRYLNARNTLSTLLSYHIIPIINENDAVAVQEIKVGDNDTLSAMVANLVSADLLIILSDIDGLYDEDPSINKSAKLIPIIDKITPEIERSAGDTLSHTSVGGMCTKIEAAKMVISSGIPMIIVNGKKKDVIKKVINGEDIGTLFLPAEDRLKRRKHWIAYTLKPTGYIKVDDGAKDALISNGKSLLPSGVLEVGGDFESGDSVRCLDKEDREFARGLINYSLWDMMRIKGRHTSDIEKILGFKYYDEVIHRDDLVLII